MTKLMTFINSIPTLYAQLSFGTCIFLLVTYFIFDILYSKYILAVHKLRAVRSANLSVILQVLSVIGVLKYVDNILYTIPILIGIWLGTYTSLTISAKYEIKRKKGKK